MQRKRLFLGISGISVLVIAAGIVVTGQGNRAPKSTHTTTPQQSTATKSAAKPAAAKGAAPKTAPPAATAAKPQAAPSSKAAPSATAQKPAPVASATKPQTTPVKPDATASKTTPKPPAAAAAKSEKAPASKVAKADTKTAKPEKVVDTKVAKADKPSKTAAPTTTTQLTPVQQKLKDNTTLAGKIESRLPKGTNLMTAADGFRDLGQFVAAVNVANNLNVSFDELKTKIVTNKMSLGQAIQAVRPLTASPTIEAQRAEYDARGVIAESAQAEASPAPKTHGPVTTPTSTETSSPVKTKSKTTKTSAQ